MVLDLALVFAGGALLYYGAEWLIGGAARLAGLLGVSPLVIGLTVVSYGTSAPELVVSLVSALQGKSAIAFGNVVGSNIANIGIVLGLSALIAPPKVDARLFKREVPFLLVATLATGPVLLNGRIDRYEGIAFFLGAIAFTLGTFKWSQATASKPPVVAEAVTKVELGTPAPTPSRLAPQVGRVVLGLLLLVAGGESFVRGSVSLAQMFGISDRVIGLTLVAIGTSLPELAASVVAALRGHSDLAVGNVVGSNLFNILLIIGTTATVSPMPGSLVEVRYDLVVMTLFTFAMAASLRSARHITRAEGALYLLGYVGFVGGLVLT